MKDYNFFSEYVFTKSRLKVKKLILPVVFLIVIGGIVTSYVLLEMVVSDREEQIEHQEALLNTKEAREIQHKVAMMEEELINLAFLSEEAIGFAEKIDKDYIVTEYVTEMIVESIPQNIAFTTYDIGGDGVLITGLATSYSDIAEFENNLRELGDFYNIFVGSIASNENDGLFTFSLTIELRGDKND